MDLVIRNGTVLSPGGRLKADIGVEGGSIAAVDVGLRGTDEIDASGCYVLPGGVDPHVHLQMPAGDYVSSDSFASGTAAAALGGTTTVIDFVEPEPGEPFLEALERRRAEADGQVVVDYGLHMTIPTWHAAHPASLTELPAVVEAGVSSFKLYLAYEGFRLNDAQLYETIAAVNDADGLPIAHCENGPICEHLRAQAVAHGQTAPRYHAVTRPPRQEAEAVSRLIDIASLAGSPVYVVHVSCRAALDRIEAAQTRGDVVYSETCPQYLLLDKSALIGDHGERMICAPPLRVEADRQALWRALKTGAVDLVATDHCPFTADEKAGHAAFTEIPGGLPSIEARLALVQDARRAHGMSLEDVARVCSTRAADIFGLSTKGRIAVGLDADLVIFDPRRQVTLEPGETLHERVDWSPYAGMHVRGWTRDVISGGKVMVRGGEFVGRIGHGEFVPRVSSEHIDLGNRPFVNHG